MKLRKRITAFCTAVLMSVSLASIGASASYATSYTLKKAKSAGKDDGTKTISCTTLNGDIGELHWYWNGSKGYSECTSDGYTHFAVANGKTNSASADVGPTKTAKTDKVKPSKNDTIYYGGTVVT
ncbi:hypothetical protein [Ruminococcus albus]|uniref:Ig-like domain-containing protein n=1 Tax=Ruminococcus albus (strain ATCC 27210 / DSM 20455 / JCM 14654 / NCDO 2250 / 7) TaxID=697329 RepID=E6UJD1_RUMA7|nr:hypothetical protein [Ruminococcus albus]ADU23777.1 hypothetical protein Rumal_3314 [Ruminococcus albus 7 = DSM 20455]